MKSNTMICVILSGCTLSLSCAPDKLPDDDKNTVSKQILVADADVFEASAVHTWRFRIAKADVEKYSKAIVKVDPGAKLILKLGENADEDGSVTLLIVVHIDPFPQKDAHLQLSVQISSKGGKSSNRFTSKFKEITSMNKKRNVEFPLEDQKVTLLKLSDGTQDMSIHFELEK